VFGAVFLVLSALSATILAAVNWRPWRIYRCVVCTSTSSSSSPSLQQPTEWYFLVLYILRNGVVYFGKRTHTRVVGFVV
jgi:hypothetical protein